MEHQDSIQFMIKKAIFWSLREYGKTNVAAVIEYVSHSDLKTLSKKEALKNLTNA
ncbi:DNA alkylation repair protein [Flavobacterium muglaense]|nr:DNA alkylation repair protein [Flavobacterium muglaense]